MVQLKRVKVIGPIRVERIENVGYGITDGEFWHAVCYLTKIEATQELENGKIELTTAKSDLRLSTQEGKTV